MAVIKPAQRFQGSDANLNTRIIKSGIPVVSFAEKKNEQGNFFFILPAYRLDDQGNGVWFKLLEVRDQFGTGERKDRFAVQSNCPIAYFEATAKRLFPDFAAVTQGPNGRKIYPVFGRQTKRMLFNAAYYNELALGAHVLDLPMYNAGDVIYNWASQTRPDGSQNGLLNDPDAACPVRIQLDIKNSKGNPWKISVDGQRLKLPDQVADSNYLHNLDNVVHYISRDELVERLRACVPADLFETCMSAWLRQNQPVTVNIQQVTDGPNSMHPMPIPPPPLMAVPVNMPGQYNNVPQRNLGGPLPPSLPPMPPMAPQAAPPSLAPRFNPPSEPEDDIPMTPVAHSVNPMMTREAVEALLRKAK